MQLHRFPVIPCKGNYSTHRINSSTRILQEILQLQGSSHAGRYKASSSNCSPCIQAFYTAETILVPYKDSQASSNSTHRNSILSGSQHPHTPYKIPQVHFYRILQGEIGFFSKWLSIALSCSTKVSDFRNSLSYCFLHIELFYKNSQEN